MKSMRLAAIAALFAAFSLAQTTTVTGTLVTPTNDKVSGACDIQAVSNWSTPGGRRVVNGPSVTVNFTSGALSVKLLPNDTGTPSPQYYTVSCSSPPQTVNGRRIAAYTWPSRIWTIPTSSSPVDVSAVEQSTSPTALTTYSDWKLQSTPGAPTAGFLRVWADSTSNAPCWKTPAGVTQCSMLPNGAYSLTGSWDFRGSSHSLPDRSGTGSPVARDSCLYAGESYFQTDATAGQNVFRCTAAGTPGTWVLSSGAVLSVYGRSGAVTAQSGDYSAFYAPLGLGPSGGSISFSSTPTCTVTANSTAHTCDITLTGDVTASTVDLANAKQYQAVTWRICQDGTGGHAWTWAPNVIDGGAVDTRLNVCSTQVFRVIGTNIVAVAMMKNDSATDDIRTSSGVWTFQSGSHTFVGRSTTDTLLNKTISGANNTLTVREADQSLSDVTTGNVSTGAHGYISKLPNDATKYFNGVGAWVAPASVTAGCGITMTGTALSWNPADIKNCTGAWEDFFSYAGVANYEGSAMPWSKSNYNGAWTTGGPNPTTYGTAQAMHMGVLRVVAPATADPTAFLTPSNHFGYLAVMATSLEWTIGAALLQSDVTNGRMKYGLANNMNVGSDPITGGSAGIYFRYDPVAVGSGGAGDTTMKALLCTSSAYPSTNCDVVDFGAAPTASGWNSFVLQRQTTGLSAPKVTAIWNGVTRTFCSSGCDSTDGHAPTASQLLYYGTGMGISGSGGGYWEFDALAMFFQNLGR